MKDIKRNTKGKKNPKNKSGNSRTYNKTQKNSHNIRSGKAPARDSARDTPRSSARTSSDSKPDTTPRPKASNKEYWLYGKHAVLAALQNKKRHIKRLVINQKNTEQYSKDLSDIHNSTREITPEIVRGDFFEKILPSDAVHQGIALSTSPLHSANIKDVCALNESNKEEKNLVLMLDQVTDPHNVGAIIRSATAFGAKAIITTDRHAPPESAVLAKSASGALEAIAWIRVTNLSRVLDELADMGYWRLGLDGHADQMIGDNDFGNNLVLILGAEGKGLRKGTKAHIDALIKLPIKRTVESLNVSNAAAVALYELAK